MTVSGEEAKKWKAIDATSYRDIAVNLIEANEDTGEVAFLDKTGEKKTVSLGPHRVRLVLKNARDGI